MKANRYRSDHADEAGKHVLVFKMAWMHPFRHLGACLIQEEEVTLQKLRFHSRLRGTRHKRAAFFRSATRM